MTDHTGNRRTAIDGVNKPDLQVADDDDAVGAPAQAISRSTHAQDTLAFVVGPPPSAAPW